MKKFLTVTIIVIMSFTMVACGSSKTSSSSGEKYADSEYLGTWELVGYKTDGADFPVGEHDVTTLTLNPDGTFVDVSEAAVGEDGDEWQEVTTKGTWEETEIGFTTTDDIFTLEYKVKDNNATAEYGSTTLIREKK